MEAYDFVANGWAVHDSQGFIGLVGPVWQRSGPEGLMLAFQADEKHRNLRGVVQGGMLMTMADRLLGAYARSQNSQRPQVTVQFDAHFLAPVRIGDVVIGRARMLRNTRALMFLEGELTVGETEVLSAKGIWKKLDA
jgi:acyl-coenzyme A thioesterase PaaI-like protein